MNSLRHLRANWQAVAILMIFLLSFATFNILFDAAAETNYFKEILAALIGTILAAVVTTMLLKSQTKGEELRERNVEVFRTKLEAYNNFVALSAECLDDNKLTVSEVRKLKQFAYRIALFSSEETASTVTRFIRSRFLSEGEPMPMSELVNSFRTDLSLEGVSGLNTGDLDIIEMALRDPTSLEGHVSAAEELLLALRKQLIDFSDGRYAVEEMETELGTSPEGTVLQLQSENGLVLNLNANYDEMSRNRRTVEVDLDLSHVKAAMRKKLQSIAMKCGFRKSGSIEPNPEFGPEATVVGIAEAEHSTREGEMTSSQLADAIAALVRA